MLSALSNQPELSHPAWVCGLKLDEREYMEILSGVTPCVGVWIETVAFICDDVERKVTPCVGVWIETKGWAALEYDSTSHPAWVCGLKR